MGNRRAFTDYLFVAWWASASQPSAGVGRCVLDHPYRRHHGATYSIWRQFRRWRVSGIWDVLLQRLADRGGELDALQMIHSTTIRAHRCAAASTP